LASVVAAFMAKKRNCSTQKLIFHGSYFKVSHSLTDPVLLRTAAIGIHADLCLLFPLHGISVNAA